MREVACEQKRSHQHGPGVGGTGVVAIGVGGIGVTLTAVGGGVTGVPLIGVGLGPGVLVAAEAGPINSFANTPGNSHATERLPSLPGPWAYSILIWCCPAVNGILSR